MFKDAKPLQTLLTACFLALALIAAMPDAVLGAEPENDPPVFQGRQFTYTILKPPQAAPAAPLYTPRGGITTLRRYQGKVVLLNVWATWCPACLHEMPSLDKLQEKLGGDRFSVVTLSIDSGDGKKVVSYLKRLGIKNLPVYLDPVGRIAKTLGMHEGLPWSFIINPRGRVMGYMKGGADWASPQALALIRYYFTPHSG